MKLPSTFIGLTFLTILAYLALAHFTGAARLLSTGADAYVGGVKALQGR